MRCSARCTEAMRVGLRVSSITHSELLGPGEVKGFGGTRPPRARHAWTAREYTAGRPGSNFGTVQPLGADPPDPPGLPPEGRAGAGEPLPRSRHEPAESQPDPRRRADRAAGRRGGPRERVAAA